MEVWEVAAEAAGLAEVAAEVAATNLALGKAAALPVPALGADLDGLDKTERIQIWHFLPFLAKIRSPSNLEPDQEFSPPAWQEGAKTTS